MSNDRLPASVKRRNRISAVWLIPIFAVIVGLSFIYVDYQQRGAEIVLNFKSAEGIVAGKTKLRHLSIDVGEVTEVALNESLDAVVVRALVERSVLPLMREDTRFWVVRPRIGSGGISGIGTLLSGAFISFSEGVSENPSRSFIGSEEPPVSPASAPGVRVRLSSRDGGDLHVGQPVLYKGFRVGQVEGVNFDYESELLIAQVFIEAPYHTLLNTMSRFWNISGVKIQSSASGIELATGSLESILIGGISFDVPRGAVPGEPVGDNTEFDLYSSREKIDQIPYQHSFNLTMLYSGSVRGLLEGAPVEFRGIRVGNVAKIGFDLIDRTRIQELSQNVVAPVPIELRIEPARLLGEDNADNIEKTLLGITRSVKNGLRATLRQGSLITGAQYVSLEPLAAVGEGAIEEHDGRLIMPSQDGGITALTEKLGATLDTINGLPLEGLMLQLQRTMKETQNTLQTAGRALTGYAADAPLYGSAEDSLLQLRSTLQTVDQLVDVLKNKPNEIIFSKPKAADRIPRGAGPKVVFPK